MTKSFCLYCHCPHDYTPLACECSCHYQAEAALPRPEEHDERKALEIADGSEGA